MTVLPFLTQKKKYLLAWITTVHNDLTYCHHIIKTVRIAHICITMETLQFVQQLCLVQRFLLRSCSMSGHISFYHNPLCSLLLFHKYKEYCILNRSLKAIIKNYIYRAHILHEMFKAFINKHRLVWAASVF